MDTAIREDLPLSYGLTAGKAEPVSGGWQNRKWRVQTGTGPVLVKQFSRTRFNDRQLADIAAALRRQCLVGKAGIPCPTVLLTIPDRQPIRYLEDGTVYMVMTFCEGHMETPQTITDRQMYDLGETLGAMHRVFGRLPVDGVKGYPIDSTRVWNELSDSLRGRSSNIAEDALPSYRAAIRSLLPILDTLSPDFFDRLPKGIAHEDFSPDNLLFSETGVSAVLDFDRNCFSFLWHDIGRALMSLAWNDGVLRHEKVRAFLSGYAVSMPISAADAADALRLTWCIETLWWMQPDFFGECSPKVARFRDEILWLTDHWHELDALTGQEGDNV